MLHLTDAAIPRRSAIMLVCEGTDDLPAMLLRQDAEPCVGCGGVAYLVETQAGNRFIACARMIRRVN
jgi:hypothetical protein